MSLEIETAMQKLGPQGGDLSTPYSPAKAEWRTEHFNGEKLADGNIGLHRFVRDHDSAVPGKQNEQPWHRMAAYMLNAGRTNSEIAMAADVTPTSVSHLRSQRWFQELCATIANTEGEEILGLIRSETATSVETIVEIRDDTSLAARTRLAAAQILLEQAHGKPTQKVLSGHLKPTYSSPEDEMRALQEELEALRAKSSSSSPEISAASPS